MDVVEDLNPPLAQILSPVAGQTFSRGATVSIELEVSDDTVLHLARFTVGGDYAATLGLKTENSKTKPSFDEPRTVVFDYQLPAKGKTGALEISVDVTDVRYNSLTTAVVVNVDKSGSDAEATDTEKTSTGKGHGRGPRR